VFRVGLFCTGMPTTSLGSQHHPVETLFINPSILLSQSHMELASNFSELLVAGPGEIRRRRSDKRYMRASVKSSIQESAVELSTSLQGHVFQLVTFSASK